jgi:hypothetical protein
VLVLTPAGVLSENLLEDKARVSSPRLTVPAGFFTDFLSALTALHSRQNGRSAK